MKQINYRCNKQIEKMSWKHLLDDTIPEWTIDFIYNWPTLRVIKWEGFL